MFTSIKRIFRFGWHSLTRDGGMITANIFILTMVIFVISFLFFAQNLSQFLISNIETKVDISVYFKSETAEEDILKTKEELSNIPEVKEVNYVSKQEALENFTARNKNNPILMESLQEVGVNPFLPSLGVKAFQAHQYEAVVSFLARSQFDPLIEKIDYYERKPIIENIFAVTSTFNKFGIVFSIILAVIAVLVAFNTIRLSIYNSREEIKIQKLVGASSWFIRGPFVVQGAISGFLAALICFLLFILLSWSFNSRAEFLFSGFGLFAFLINNLGFILLIQLASGIGLGSLASLLAVRKHLKV